MGDFREQLTEEQRKQYDSLTPVQKESYERQYLAWLSAQRKKVVEQESQGVQQKVESKAAKKTKKRDTSKNTPSSKKQKKQIAVGNEDNGDVTVGEFMIEFLLLFIPIVDIVAMLGLAFGKEERKSKVNFAKAAIPFAFVFTIIMCIMFVLAGRTITGNSRFPLDLTIKKEATIKVINTAPTEVPAQENTDDEFSQNWDNTLDQAEPTEPTTESTEPTEPIGTQDSQVMEDIQNTTDEQSMQDTQDLQGTQDTQATQGTQDSQSTQDTQVTQDTQGLQIAK